MRRAMIHAAAVLAVMMLLCTAASADASGVRVLNQSDKVTLEFQTAKGESVSEATEGVYLLAEKVVMTVPNFGSGNCVVYVKTGDGVPTEENLRFLDVQTVEAGGGAQFVIYPAPVVTKQTYSILYKNISTGELEQAAEVEFTRLMGDPSGDNYIDATDSLYTLQMFVGIKNGGKDWTEEQRLAADVNRDGYTDATDSLWMLQRFVGLLDEEWHRK